MAPSLRISAGKDVSSLQLLNVNSEEPLEINTPDFQGRLVVRIKNFTGQVPPSQGAKKDSQYFDRSYAKGCTWSIQVQGRFRSSICVDDVEFGNKFDKSIKDHLPWGTSAALTAIGYIDPNLRHDVYCDEPWAFSPLLCTMTRISIERVVGSTASDLSQWPTFPSGQSEDDYVQENTSVLLCSPHSQTELDPELDRDGIADLSTLSQLRPSDVNAHHHRARFFGNQDHRDRIAFQPSDVWTSDFCNGFIDFNTLRLELPYTGGMGFDLTRYWDGQPVRYYCKDKKNDKVFFVVEFQIAEKEAS